MSGLTARAMAVIADAVRPGLWSPPGHQAAASSIVAGHSISAERIAAVRAEVERHKAQRAPAAAAMPRRLHQPPVATTASTPDGWRAEWNASAALQAEFASAESYVALRSGEAAGRVKVISKMPAALSAAATPDEWRAEWQASAALRAEFERVEDYVALRKAAAAGRVKLWR